MAPWVLLKNSSLATFVAPKNSGENMRSSSLSSRGNKD
jgi:hypothetical protein